jgi:hypothetical protein
MTENSGQHIIEIVRHSACYEPKSFNSLLVVKLQTLPWGGTRKNPDHNVLTDPTRNAGDDLCAISTKQLYRSFSAVLRILR